MSLGGFQVIEDEYLFIIEDKFYEYKDIYLKKLLRKY